MLISELTPGPLLFLTRVNLPIDDSKTENSNAD